MYMTNGSIANINSIVKMKQDIERLSENYSTILQEVRALSINYQTHLKCNRPIAPGIACKVAFDTNGLVLKGDVLQVTDIPDLQIDKIIGLRNTLNDKVSKSDIEHIKVDILDQKLKKGMAVGTGTKVNFDNNGLIVSTAELSVADIPELPISKISGLEDILDRIGVVETSTESFIHPSVAPNTFTKISFDKNGHVVKGEMLGINDMPTELLSRINRIESAVPTLASQQTVDAISKSMIKKIDGNPNITPGTFTKVRVDSKGLVVSGDSITLRDLPTITIDDIDGLRSTLNQKAEHDMVLNINDVVNQFSSVVSQVSELLKMKTALDMKADISSVKAVESRQQSLQTLLDSLITSIPNDTIMLQLTQIQNELSTLGGRISVIEKKLMDV